jgi:hypothetical protein
MITPEIKKRELSESQKLKLNEKIKILFIHHLSKAENYRANNSYN